MKFDVTLETAKMKCDTGTIDEIGVAVESWLYIYGLEKVPL